MGTPVSTREEIGTVLATSDRLHIRLFGGVELASNGVPLRRTRSRTETWLLALLILRANQSIERSWLAGTFWPETREAQALNNLRRSLSNLRQVLGEESYRLLSPTQHTIAFDLADAFCDVTAFDTALARRDAVSLRRAVGLYRGPLLPDCDADWVLPERSAREQAFLTALETLAEQAVRDGDMPEAVRHRK
jgi:DNA-binding SARP family transcriptional activator